MKSLAQTQRVFHIFRLILMLVSVSLTYKLYLDFGLSLKVAEFVGVVLMLNLMLDVALRSLYAQHKQAYQSWQRRADRERA